jgi:DNA polymerase-3 subunit epsilon
MQRMSLITPELQFLLKQDLVFVDLETTGFDPIKDRVVEVGVVRIKNGQIIDTFNSLVNPGLPEIPSSVERITGIKPKQLLKAPPFSEIKQQVFNLLRNALFVAHNVEFDYGFIECEFERHSLPYSAPRLCTVKLSRELYPDFVSHNLDSISQRFEIPIDNRHRAMDDALATWEFYRKSHEKLGERQVQQAVIKLVKEAKPKRVSGPAKAQMKLF